MFSVMLKVYMLVILHALVAARTSKLGVVHGYGHT